MPDQAGNLTKAEVSAIAAALAVQLRGTTVTQGPVSGVSCPVCGHVGAPDPSGNCPNENCPRHQDGTIAGLHPETGDPTRDPDEHRANVIDHAQARAAGKTLAEYRQQQRAA